MYYKSPELEIEEYYDSTDPRKCYKMVKKEGEPPQITNGSEFGGTKSLKNQVRFSNAPYK